nr:N-acetylmuramoyl-L-alanine amidase [Clostridium sp. MCC353]
MDAGHGGSDPGASYNGRREKDDTLNLALAVGKALQDQDVNVLYTRVDDTYDTPFEKAAMANKAEADYFISLHRNAMTAPGTGSGAESLVFENAGAARMLAENINSALEEVGFSNLGIIERPGLVILRRTKMPSVLVEVGFIDNEADNRFFDRRFDDIAKAVAAGIMKTIEEEEAAPPEYYQIQTGAFRNRELADQMLEQLQSEGFPAFLVYEDDFYKVRVGAFLSLDNAAQMEKALRDYGYNTFIVYA